MVKDIAVYFKLLTCLENSNLTRSYWIIVHFVSGAFKESVMYYWGVIFFKTAVLLVYFGVIHLCFNLSHFQLEESFENAVIPLQTLKITPPYSPQGDILCSSDSLWPWQISLSDSNDCNWTGTVATHSALSITLDAICCFHLCVCVLGFFFVSICVCLFERLRVPVRGPSGSWQMCC